MNYCDKIHYTIYKTNEASFERAMEALFAQLPEDSKILRLIVFGAPGSSGEYMKQRILLQNAVSVRFGNRKPALSYVAQPPLESKFVMEVHYYIPDCTDRILYKMYNGNWYVLLENECARFLFSGGYCADSSTDIYTLSQTVFTEIKHVLDIEKFTIDSIVRQWNYIEHITALGDYGQHYQMFNNARSEFYSSVSWKNGYPAATGIGSSYGGVLVDFDAVQFLQSSCYCTPIDNKLQVAAHAYSERVLLAADNKRTTPKFERAKSMTFGNRRTIYISGTAAIRGEESLEGVGVERQLEITLENIAQLTGEVKIRMLRVYLKNVEDYAAVKRCLSAYEAQIPISYLRTDVCRDELLIEIEGIAIE